MARNNVNNICIENARIIFRNFSGEPTTFNKNGGKRTFSVVLDEDTAVRLREDGWNVKPLKSRDPDEPPAFHLSVEASYRNYPPRVYLIAGKKKTELTEDTISTLDYAEIKNADIIINPYSWEVQGKSGIKAYLKTMYVTVVEDEFEKKYRDYGDDSDDEDDGELPF